MIGNYAILVQSNAIDDIEELTPRIALAAQRAINKIATRARTKAQRGIQQQVNLPARYLGPSGRRLTVSKRATGPDDLTAVITGRHRPTSLARFATGARQSGKRGVRVQVEPGVARFLPKAFFVNLRSGNTDTKNNRGLAIRLPDGQSPDRAYRPTKLGKGLWLLYGPSVDQIFDDVAEEISDETADELSVEFQRLLGVDID